MRSEGYGGRVCVCVCNFQSHFWSVRTLPPSQNNFSSDNLLILLTVKIDDDCEGSDCGLSAGVLAAIICGAVFIPLSCLVAVAGCLVRLRLRKLKKSESIL